MKAPTMIAVAALQALLIAFAAPSVAQDPLWLHKQIMGDDAQSRIENERRERELARQREQAWQRLQRMNDDSSRTKTYNLLDCPDINDLSDPSCEEERRRMNEGRRIPPQVTPTPPRPRVQQRPAGPNCEPSGLFGAPPQDCIDPNNRPGPKPPRYVGEGPCRRDASNPQTVGGMWDGRACQAYFIRVADKECGDEKYVPFHNGALLVRVLECRSRVHKRVLGND